jgi:hypothetical protein
MTSHGKPCPYPVDPSWQNFSSLHREACAADEATTAVEKSHHMMAALYFGIAALEAFLNQQMRLHLQQTKPPEDVLKLLRKTEFLKKLDRWPSEITRKPLLVPAEARELIRFCNEVRGDLTHPKVVGHVIYERLLTVTPTNVVDAVASYIVAFHQAQGTTFPYWVSGWNYLNPRTETHDIIVLNEQCFRFSLAALGFQVPTQGPHCDAWTGEYLGTLDGYKAIRTALCGAERCEPKSVRFPYQPILCRRWWTSEHHQTCGHASREAIATARELDGL